MPAQDRSQDPRWIVTPDAFSVDPDLLGRPLGQHPRRLAAILLDLLVIVLLTRLPGFLLAILAALFLFRMATRRNPDETPSAMRSLFRGTVGCFGAVVMLIAVLATWSAVSGIFNRSAPEGERPRSAVRADLSGLGQAFQGISGGLQDLSAFRNAESEAEAEAVARRLAPRIMALEGVGEHDEILTLLHEMAPSDAPWRAAIAEWSLFPTEGTPGEGGPGDPGGATLALGPEEGTDPADGNDGAEAGIPSPEEEVPLSPREVALLDSLALLERQVDRSRSERDRMQGQLAAAEARAEEAESGGLILRFLRRIAEDLGLGLGWGALYFSAFGVWGRGKTPGKRVMRLKVVRLDGKPITWWNAFERYGGYAAGFATGLLGFAQVFWDPNRQAIHDKIAGTTVIQDGKPPVPGLWAVQGPRPPILDRKPAAPNTHPPKEH